MTDRLRCLLVANVALAATLVVVGCGDDTSSTPPTSPTTCSYSVSQPTTTFGPEGGTGSAGVTTASTCTWTAVSNAGFVTVSSGASGTGNGTVQFAVAANTGGDRTATLTVAGTAIAIAQRAAVTVPATLSAPSAKSPIGGQFIAPGRPTVVINNAVSTGNIGTVTYRFEVSDQPSFPAEPVRTFIADGVAQGAGTTSWVVNHDLGPDVLWYWRARATNGTVTSDYSTVETFSTASPCSFVLTPASAAVNGAGGTTTFTVTTGNNCAWVASTTNTFLSVSGGGTGNGSISVIVSAQHRSAAHRHRHRDGRRRFRDFLDHAGCQLRLHLDAECRHVADERGRSTGHIHRNHFVPVLCVEGDARFAVADRHGRRHEHGSGHRDVLRCRRTPPDRRGLA